MPLFPSCFRCFSLSFHFCFGFEIFLCLSFDDFTLFTAILIFLIALNLLLLTIQLTAFLFYRFQVSCGMPLFPSCFRCFSLSFLFCFGFEIFLCLFRPLLPFLLH